MSYRFNPKLAGKSRTYLQDAGHGWLSVPMQEVIELGIAPDITIYSYINLRTGRAYLEEDCDMTTFINAYEKKHGEQPKFSSSYCRQSKIRTSQEYYNFEIEYVNWWIEFCFNNRFAEPGKEMKLLPE